MLGLNFAVRWFLQLIMSSPCPHVWKMPRSRSDLIDSRPALSQWGSRARPDLSYKIFFGLEMG
jgi:hypothetical protein